MSILWRSLVTLVLLHESFSRKFNPGPSVDPGVFVITHISTCRNGAGYCILGFSCEVDKDFTKDDLGGHCSGLGAAFNPKGIYIRFALISWGSVAGLVIQANWRL